MATTTKLWLLQGFKTTLPWENVTSYYKVRPMKPTSYRKLVAGFSLFVSLALPAAAATPMVAAGLSHSMALTSEGKVLTWGADNSGQLGTGRQSFFASPQDVKNMNLGLQAKPAQLAAGTYHNAVVKADGSVWTWGDNLLGQLGDGSLTAKSTPTALPGFGPAVAVSAGFAFTVALKADGSVWSWGSNDSGALGTGKSEDDLSVSLTPVAVYALDGRVGLKVQSIATGLSHALAVIDGVVVAWGRNDVGQLGDGTDTPNISPQIVAGPTNVVAVAAGASHSLALDNAGTVWVWGSNASGQLGDPNFLYQGAVQARQLPGLPRMMAVTAGTQHSLALAEDQSVWAWGSNENLQLGVSGIAQRTAPAKVPGLSGIVSIKAHYNHNTAVDAAGNVWMWGSGSTGQLGDGSAADRATPARVPGLSGVLAAEPGFAHTIAVTQDGQLKAWGENLAGQLGQTNDTDRTVPGEVLGLSNIVSIAGGLRHSLAAQSDGTVWAWGYNLGGQLGDGKADSKTSPIKVPAVSGITQVSAGTLHSVARKSDGTVWSWGSNSDGELGTGTATQSSTAKQALNLTSVSQVAAGSGFSVARRTDGSVWSWGVNKLGELGVLPGTTGSHPYRAQPARIAGLPNMTAIAAGTSHVLALAEDGSVWAWGDQTDGILGNGHTEAGSALPARVAGLTNVIAIAAGSNQSMAVRQDGSVWVWGLTLTEDNSYPSPVPAQFAGLGNATSIAAGLAHHLVGKSDGSVWSWGINIEGGLGDGTYAFHQDSVAVLNAQFSNLLDLNIAVPNLPVDPSKLPTFFAATQKLGSKRSTSLSVDLRGLANPPAAPAGAKVRPNATLGYNVYVAASLPNGTQQPLYFQLHGVTGWGNLVWPIGEYLRGVALDNQDSVVRAQILTDADLTGLEGASIYIGYGLDATEMATSGRFRVIYKVPK